MEAWAVIEYEITDKKDEDEVILDVPYIHQRNDTNYDVKIEEKHYTHLSPFKFPREVVFDGTWACGATSAVMIAAYHERLGDKFSEHELGKYVCKEYKNIDGHTWVYQPI